MPLDRDAFLESLVYSETGSAVQVERDVATLRGLDLRAEGVQRRWALAVGGFLLAGVAALAFANESAWTPVSAIPLAAAVFGALVSFRIVHSAERVDTENRRYELLGKLVGLTRIDMAPDAELSVQLDLRPALHPDKRARTEEVGPWSVETYEDMWLQLRGQLLDGTRFTVLVEERRRQRVRRAEGPGNAEVSGPLKEARFLVELQPHARSHRDLAALGNGAEQAVRLPAFAQLAGLQIEDDVLRLEATTTDAWTAAGPTEVEGAEPAIELLATMFLSLYQVVRLSLQRTTQQAG